MGADDAEHLLEVIRVGGSYPEDPVCLAGDGVRLNNFGDGGHHFAHPLRRHSALAVDLDKGLNRPAQSRGFNVGGERRITPLSRSRSTRLLVAAVDSPM